MTTKKETSEKRAQLEEIAGVRVTHRGDFDAAGNNDLVWERFLARTLDEAIAKATADRDRQPPRRGDRLDWAKW
jgi:hypothetical protein